MDLKVIEPVKTPLKEFEGPDEFNLYYHKHKDEIDSQTTHILNRKYKINGYRITKIKGVLCLKNEGKNYYQIHKNELKGVQSEIKNEEDQDTIHSVQQISDLIHELGIARDLKVLQERIEQLEQSLNEVIDYINNRAT